jgi:hypothetical protein
MSHICLARSLQACKNGGRVTQAKTLLSAFPEEFTPHLTLAVQEHHSLADFRRILVNSEPGLRWQVQHVCYQRQPQDNGDKPNHGRSNNDCPPNDKPKFDHPPTLQLVNAKTHLTVRIRPFSGRVITIPRCPTPRIFVHHRCIIVSMATSAPFTILMLRRMPPSHSR